MSLKVWLLLNGDLHNQGISNYTTSLVSGNAFTTSGKIGNSSLHVTKLQPILPNSTASCMQGAKQMSYAYWVKVNTAWTANWLDGIRWISTDGSATHTSRQEFYTNCTLIGTWFQGDSISSKSFTPGVWTHIAGTFNYNTGEVCFYINGTLSQRKTTLATTHYCRGDFWIGDNGVDIQQNDVRIYDHCLSAAEVKEISQGLVLHYKLNGPFDGIIPNLGTGSQLLNQTASKENTYFGKRGNATIQAHSNEYNEVQCSASWQGLSLYANLLDLQIGTNYTYSFYGYTNSSNNTNATVSFYPMMYNSSGTRDTSSTLPISVQGGAFTNVNSKVITKFTTTPTLYWATFTWNQTMADILNNGGRIELSIQSAGTFNSGRIDYMWAPKLEKGNIPTMRIGTLNEIISSYSEIIDNSGYNNNGSKLNTIALSTDTPRYACSTQLVSGNSAINCGRGGMVTDSITVNFWLKSSAWANPISCTESGGWNFETADTCFRFPIYIASVGYKYCTSTTTKAQICNNQWHMLTGMYDRLNQKIKIYVDGELDNDSNIGTSNLIGYNGTNVIWLGAEASSSATAIASNGMIGFFSDLRIYCTALSGDDIKQLYNLGMKIDNLQNIHTFELNEQGGNNLSLKRQGILVSEEFKEDSKASFYKDHIIEASEFIEY